MLIAGTVGSARKTPNTIPSSRVAAFFSPHSAGKSTNLLVACLSFPLRRGCHSEISADGVEAAVWAAHCQGGDPSMGQKLAGNLKGGAFFFFLYSGLWAFSVKCWTFFFFLFFHLAAVHSVDLNRCSPSASHYLRHPPIICFTNLPPPPSPLLASPLILDLVHPSAARNCVSAAHEGTTRPARM